MGAPVDVTKTPRRILIADDQTDLLAALRILLRGEGFVVTTVESPQAVLAAIEDQDFDVALVDLNYSRDTTSGQEGFDLLTEIQRRDRALPVLVMTAWGSVDGAVEALNRGARDYITKPWEVSELEVTLLRAMELYLVETEHESLRSQTSSNVEALAAIERVHSLAALSVFKESSLRNVAAATGVLIDLGQINFDDFNKNQQWKDAYEKHRNFLNLAHAALSPTIWLTVLRSTRTNSSPFPNSSTLQASIFPSSLWPLPRIHPIDFPDHLKTWDHSSLI